MKKILFKAIRILLYVAAGALVLLAGFYIYLALRAGRPAELRTYFDRLPAHPLVFAHRGGGGVYPENTLGAFQHSSEIGADVLELDIHSTRDGALVVFHDASVDRTTDGHGKIADFPLAELKKLDAGFRFTTDGGQTFPFRSRGVTVSTLAEVFDAFPDKRFNIEPKQVTPSVSAPLCALIRDRKLTGRVIVGAFRGAAVEEFREICPDVATAATPSEAIWFFVLYKVGLAASARPTFQALQIPPRLGALGVVDRGFVDAAHRMNVAVHVWTINDVDEMKRLAETGTDGIMSDFPERAVELFSRNE